MEAVAVRDSIVLITISSLSLHTFSTGQTKDAHKLDRVGSGRIEILQITASLVGPSRKL